MRYLTLLMMACAILLPGKNAAAEEQSLKKAYFAGGCFWCIESDFEKYYPKAVKTVISGYAGGHVDKPTYKQVSKGNTGHIEAIEITYDPKLVTYKELLEVLMTHVDPTDDGGQFCDRGYQYQSAVFYQNETEQKEMKEIFAWAEKQLKQKIKMHQAPYKNFYPAETYHQDYYKKNPLRYKYYRHRCGRDKRVLSLWADYKAAEESQIRPAF